MERSVSRSLPYLPRYQSLSPARSPLLGGRKFASLRSVSSPSHTQRICYIDAGEPTKVVSTSYRGRGSPSPKRSYKVHLFGPAFSADGKKRVHHATRVTRSVSAHDLHASHVYTSQDDLIPGATRHGDSRRVCTSLQDLFHKGPFHPDATTASESGVSLGGMSDESLSLCGGDDQDNMSQHSFDSSSAFHELTFDSEFDRCDSSDAYFSGAEGNGFHHPGERLLDVLFKDDPDSRSSDNRRKRVKQNFSSPLSYGEHRRWELQFPSIGEHEYKTQAKLQALRVLIPGTDNIKASDTLSGAKDHNKSPKKHEVLSSTPLAQSTPHVSPRSMGEAKLSILASWDADDSLEEQQYASKKRGPVARLLFEGDNSEIRDGSSCYSSHSEDNFSDISSTTVGSLADGRRVKLVKRPSDKPASSKTLAGFETDNIDSTMNESSESNILNCKEEGYTTVKSFDSVDGQSKNENQEDSSGSSSKGSSNDEEGNHQVSAVSTTWQDRQTYHEGNARVMGTFGGENEDEGEEGDEEDDGNENEEKFFSGQNKKTRLLNKIKRCSPSANIGFIGDPTNQGLDVPVKLSIPLISAGKHGQEKLRKRNSLSSPPPSPEENEQKSIISKQTHDQVEQTTLSAVNIQNLDALQSNNERDDGKDKNENVRVFSPEETIDAVTALEVGSGTITGSTIIGDGLRTDESYDKYAGPGEVTEIPAVTAGHLAISSGLAQKGGEVVAQAGCGVGGEGRGEKFDTGNSRELRERGAGEEGSVDTPAYSSQACLPDRGEDGGREIEEKPQVFGLQEGGRVGERLGSDLTSPSSSLTTNIAEESQTERDKLSIWAANRGSEQCKTEVDIEGEDKRAVGKSPNAIGVTTPTGRAENNYGDSTKLTNASTQSETDVQISPSSCGERYKSELKLTLSVTVHDRAINNRSADNDRHSTTYEQCSYNNLNTSQEINNSEVQHERGNETEKSCDAKSNGDLHVIGKARSEMKRFPIDPSIVVESARAASERENPTMLVRVVATAQNIPGGSETETVRHAPHKDRPQQKLENEFPSQQPHVSKFSSSGFIDNTIKKSTYNSYSGKTESQHNSSFPSSGVELNSKLFGVNPLSENNNNNNEESNFTKFSAHGERQNKQGVNINIPRHANCQSIQGEQQTGGWSRDQDKGTGFSKCAHADFTLTEDGCRVVKQKQVVTEVCHTVVKKTHSTTVEDSSVSSENNASGSDSQCFGIRNDRSDRSCLAGDRTKDTSSKTTIVEDVEDTVTTKTTTTTTTLNLDSSSSGDSSKKTSVLDSYNNNSCNIGEYNDRDVRVQKEQSRNSTPAERDGFREKCEDRERERQDTTQQLCSTAATTSDELTRPVSGVSSDHVMREVKPAGWAARADPRVTAWHSTSSPAPPPSSSSSQHKDGGEGVNLYPVERHGDTDTTTGSRLDTLQARLAQISGLEQERTEAWSPRHTQVANTSKHTHVSPSSAPLPFSPSYQDHAEATSVLKQIVRGDTDGFLPNFSGPGRATYETNGCNGDDYDTLPENRSQVHSKNSGPTYYSYSIQVREEPTRDDNTSSAQVGNGDLRSERESYDNDYDNAPFVTTALPSRQHHHHHHLQLLKPGQLKASSLWTLQEETESLIDTLSPKPSRRTLTSLASDDEDNTSINGQDIEKQEPAVNNDIRLNPEVSQSFMSVSSAEQDLSDTAIGHKNCVSESSDFEDSDGNYSSISTGESASYRSSSYGRELTPMSDDTECIVGKMEHRSSWKGLEGVSSFSDFVTGLEESISSPCADVNNQRGNLKRRRDQSDRMFTLDNLSESLKKFTTHADSGHEAFPGHNSPVHIFQGGERDHLPFHSNDNNQFHFSQSPHFTKDSHNTSNISTSTLGHHSWASAPLEDANSEASLRLHALDMDLSRISSCGSPAPSDLSDISSAYTCTGTAQIKRHQLHVSFGDYQTASGLPSPPTRDRLPASLTTSTPKGKSIMKRPTSLREDQNTKQKHADNLRQFDQILKDFHKRTDPAEAVNEIQIMDTQETNVLTDKTSAANVSSYGDLYKDFTNDDTEKMQNSKCIVVEDENMSTYRFKRFLKKSQTKRKKGKKLMRFINKLSCVTEGVSDADVSPANKKLKTDHQSEHTVRTTSAEATFSPVLINKLEYPEPQFTTSSFFQHQNHLETRVGVLSPSSATPPQGSPASSTQSVDSGRSRADSAYSSISESLSHGSVSSPRHHFHSTRGSSSSSFHPRSSTIISDRSFSTDSAYSSSTRTPSDADRTLVDSSCKDDSMDMLSALSDVFEQLDVCEGEIDKALLDRMGHGHYRAARSSRPTRRM